MTDAPTIEELDPEKALAVLRPWAWYDPARYGVHFVWLTGRQRKGGRTLYRVCPYWPGVPPEHKWEAWLEERHVVRGTGKRYPGALLKADHARAEALAQRLNREAA